MWVAQELIRATQNIRHPEMYVCADIPRHLTRYHGVFRRCFEADSVTELFIGWITVAIRSFTLSISFNGELHGYFKTTGIYSSTIQNVVVLKWLTLLKDDLMLFSYGDMASVDVLMICLETFEGVSGLSLNPTKSSIFLAGVKDNRKRSILERVGFPEGTFPVCYLGIPLAPTSVSVKDFSPFTDAIDQFIQKWGHHTLSYAGKVELLRSVIQGVEGFWFQVFPMHDAVLRKVQSSCTQFFWVCRPGHRRWDDICTPKLEGGLGLMDIWKWNVALLTRAIWHFYRESDTIWVQFVKQYYLKSISFWEYSPRDRDSFLFKRLCSIRDRLLHSRGVGGTIAVCTGPSQAAGMLLILTWFMKL
ncbi:hypothetical protein Leryth_024858 [Lithospermum erythrorhizon]|nr:hypothetical protein Leryth_024858 [Lithospermum erythrorhizon]